MLYDVRRNDACPGAGHGRRGRLQADLRRQDARRLGRQPGVLARRGRRDRRRDDRRQPHQGQHVPDLAGRQAGRLRVEGRVPAANHNSGIQFRSFEDPEKCGKWVIGGYQADIAEPDQFDGILYGEKYRGILARAARRPSSATTTSPRSSARSAIRTNCSRRSSAASWNEYHIIAKGNKLTHSVNGAHDGRGRPTTTSRCAGPTA